MAEEYLEMTDTYPCPLSYIRGHIFKIMHHSLLVHTDARDKLATANSVHEIRTAVSMVKEASKASAAATMNRKAENNVVTHKSQCNLQHMTNFKDSNSVIG